MSQVKTFDFSLAARAIAVLEQCQSEMGDGAVFQAAIDKIREKYVGAIKIEFEGEEASEISSQPGVPASI